MRIHRFFIEQKIVPDARVVVREEKLLHQWRNVLRLKVGSEVILFDGSGYDHQCEIVALDKKQAICVGRASIKNGVAPTRQFFLFASLVKKKHFEWLLEKATELGVSQLRPIVADRSEVRKFNFERAKEILREAAEQSGRGTLPALYEPMELQNVVKEYKYCKSLAFDPQGEPFKKDGWNKEEKIGAFIGPEGGWSARELELFRNEKIPVYSLGLSTLRAETAAVAVTALLLLQS